MYAKPSHFYQNKKLHTYLSFHKQITSLNTNFYETDFTKVFAQFCTYNMQKSTFLPIAFFLFFF